MVHVNFGGETQTKLSTETKDKQAQAFGTKINLENEEDVLDIKKELRAAKRQNGLIEKVADKIKEITGYGLSAKKIETSIKNGADEKQVASDIKKYRTQQESTAQSTADIATGLLSIGYFLNKKKKSELWQAKTFKLDGNWVNDGAEVLGITRSWKNMVNSKYWPIAWAGVGAMLIGGLSKYLLMKINRIGTKQYKPDLQDDMKNKERNRLRRETTAEAKKASFKNFTSGLINGATTPLMALGGLIGVPAYIVVNSLNRYFVASNENKEKSVGGYVENIANSPLSQVAVAGTIAATSWKKANLSAEMTKNLQDVIQQLKRATLREIPTEKTSVVDELHGIVFAEGSKIDKIINSEIDIWSTNKPQKTTAEIIKELSDENIFALKFKQILSNEDDLAKALKTDCPYTRCLQKNDGSWDYTNAQDFINNAFGKGKYEIKNRMGAGTIAETYLVEDSSGKEYCIKLLKDGISADKIDADAKKIIDMIKATDKTEAEKTFLIKNFENIADGVKKEINLQSEADAARELAKTTTKAKVVVPKEVSKNGDCYVMEKADGVCMQKLLEYATAKSIINSGDNISAYDMKEIAKNLFGGNLNLEQIGNLADRQKKCKEIIENFEAIYGKEIRYDLTANELKTILKKYNDIYVEQFAKIGTDGKTIHGDLHPGNIFIDLNTYRSGREDFITLIDTGNVIKQSKNEAFQMLNMSNYIKNGDTEGISKFVLHDAKLPEGMDEAQAFKLINDELKNIFFGKEYYTGDLKTEKVLDITNKIMRNNGIIPASTNASLRKAKKSAELSMEQFLETYKRLANARKGNGIVNMGLSELTGYTLGRNRDAAIKAQEEANLKSLPRKMKKQFERTASCPSESSKEYLTYIMKQAKKESRINEEEII